MDEQQETTGIYCSVCGAEYPPNEGEQCPSCGFDPLLGMYHPCPYCDGTGMDCIDDIMPCTHCDGEGYEWWK